MARAFMPRSLMWSMALLVVVVVLLLGQLASAQLLPAIGVCLSGMEWGTAVPGRPGSDYFIPTATEYSYFHSQHLNMVRLPFRWERIQPSLRGPLAPAYLSELKAQLAIAASFNMTVLLDVHNYARYGNAVINGSVGSLTNADFADLWRRLATEFVGMPGLHGYDLMNEPHDMPSLTTWPSAAQEAINAIRTVDKSTPIHLEGNQWSGAAQWGDINPAFPLTDPSNLIRYSAHCYLDRDNSGTHFNWQAEVRAGVTVQIGVHQPHFLSHSSSHSPDQSRPLSLT
jgi:endoglucanase